MKGNFFIIVCFFFNCFGADSSDAQKSCINVWTKMDLIRAITVNPSQKKNFLCYLTDDITLAYSSVNKLLSASNKASHEDFRQLYTIIVSMKEVYQEIFGDFAIPAYIANLYLLNRILLKLEDYFKSGLNA